MPILPLEGHLLDEIFTLFLPDGQVDGCILSEDTPSLALKIEKGECDGQINMRITASYGLLRGEHYRYLHAGRCLYRLPADYAKKSRKCE